MENTIYFLKVVYGGQRDERVKSIEGRSGRVRDTERRDGSTELSTKTM